MDIKPKSLFRYVVERAKAELVKRAGPASQPPGSAAVSSRAVAAPAVAAQALLQTPAAPSSTLLSCERVSGELVRAHWALDEAARERAERLFEAPAELSVRCAVFFVDAEGVPQREVSQRPAVQAQGSAEWAVSADARCVVSVGLEREGRFVAVAYCDLTAPA